MYINTSVYSDITGTSRICQTSACRRYLQALAILDQSLRNNAERSDLASEFSTFSVRSNLNWFVNPWPFRKELKRNADVTLTIQDIGVQFSTWPQAFCVLPRSLVRGALPVSPTFPPPPPPETVLPLLVSVRHNEQRSPHLRRAFQAIRVTQLILTNDNNQSSSHESRAVKPQLFWALPVSSPSPFSPSCFVKSLPAGAQHGAGSLLSCFTRVSGMFIKAIKRGTSTRKARILWCASLALTRHSCKCKWNLWIKL